MSFVPTTRDHIDPSRKPTPKQREILGGIIAYGRVYGPTWSYPARFLVVDLDKGLSAKYVDPRAFQCCWKHGWIDRARTNHGDNVFVLSDLGRKVMGLSPKNPA